jgi:hypothetical protein
MPEGGARTGAPELAPWTGGPSTKAQLLSNRGTGVLYRAGLFTDVAPSTPGPGRSEQWAQTGVPVECPGA